MQHFMSQMDILKYTLMERAQECCLHHISLAQENLSNETA